MGLPLLVFTLPAHNPTPLQVILGRVQSDYATCAKYWSEFDPDPPNRRPSTTITTYKTAERMLQEIVKTLRRLSHDYATEGRTKTYRVVLKDEEVRELWDELCTMIDKALVGIHAIAPQTYDSAEVWVKMKPVMMVYPDLISTLQAKVRAES